MHEMLLADLGSQFYGLRAEINGKIVCIATPRVRHDRDIRNVVRGLIQRQGGDCTSCKGCIIGRSQ